MKRHSGFTIIELLIVVVIAGVIAAIGAPAMGTFIKNNRLQSKTHAVMADLLYARGEAVTRRKQVVLCRSSNPTADPPSCQGGGQSWKQGYIMFIVEDADTDYDDGVDELLRVADKASSKIELRSDTDTDEKLVYKTDGTINSGGLTAKFAICDDRGESSGRQLEVPPHGRPKIVAPVASCGNPS
jgi:type IV fimbrial biogenesis protein FimT